MPSAFISPIASPRALCSCAREHLPRVLQRRLDDRHHVQGVRRRLGVEGVEDREGVRRERLVQREVELQPLDQPDPATVLGGRVHELHHTGGEQRAVLRSGQPHQPQLGAASSWLSRSSRRIAAAGSPGRAITLSSIAWLTRIRETSASGSAATRRSNVSSVQVT